MITKVGSAPLMSDGRRYKPAANITRLSVAHEMPQVEGVRHRFEAAGGLNFHVAEAGEGDPVLLLHGWPQHWYCWRLVIPRLAERYRVLAIDLRGFGWSDIAWEGFEKETMADDVANVMAALDVERARIVGHDWGAWIGYLLAMRRPELVERLVALSTPPPFVRPTPRILVNGRRFAYQLPLASPLGPRLMRRPSYVARKVRRWSQKHGNIRNDVQRLYGRDLRASTRARAASLLYRTFLLREVGPVLAGRYRKHRLTVPTLVLHGQRDPILPPIFYEGHDRYADDLTVEKVRKAGHLLPEECPDLVSDRALEFFATEAAAQPSS
jgi:pimeloyl-ACP methyl ester carboxylesterase